ncbi:SH3 domain-containing protein [Brevibacillus sp. HD1.4A]|uniref:SH3 domain-containing protein n=1 Tax=Brevibacillus sp. HD1.4A TaxID=2738978 RepID=UPI00156B2EEF|nr:SH3 domain-containing protein [Brevibacillus sp. HD1.4A]NRQ55234.1 SH3 domain-containing protein [Brevibacillus sp. HD1.4A]
MKISSYQKSLFVRNAALVLFSLALVAVCVKLALGYRQIALYDQAKSFYDANQLLQAEESFARASDMAALSYGDEEWTVVMTRLSAMRRELEELQQKLQTAIMGKQDENVLAAYRIYQTMREKYNGTAGTASAFFQQFTAQINLEKKLADYYQQALQQAKAQSKENLEKQSYRDESFIDTLIAIPDEYYGGKQAKQDELLALFADYEKAKLRALIANASFDEVITRTASSLRHYTQQGVDASWLLTRLEKYAKDELREAIRKQDLAAFVDMAEAYRKIGDVLPTDSPTLEAISKQVEAYFKQAEQLVKAHKFQKAIELYQQLNPLQDISTLVSEVENRWLDYDPGHMLEAKYPDKLFTKIISGTELWGAKLYAFGLVEADQRLYLAAKMPNDSLLYLEQPLEVDMKSATAKLASELGAEKAPLIFVQSAGKERPFAYVGLLPELSAEKLTRVFSAEADDFGVEDREHVVLKNAVGKGEKEYALFKLTRDGLEYISKLADMLPDSPDSGTSEPDDASSVDQGASEGEQTDNSSSSQTIQVYAGPGQEYPVIGQVAKDAPPQPVEETNGWYRIEFDGKDGWIPAGKPDSAPSP